MSTITESAKAFFDACEQGKGWDVCRVYCTPDATFTAQAEPLADVKTLQQYTDWMKGLMTVLTDGRYEVKSFATHSERNNVCAYGVFTGTHLAGGPCPPDPQDHQHGVRLRHAVQGWEDRAYDQDLAFRSGAEGAWLGLMELAARR